MREAGGRKKTDPRQPGPQGDPRPTLVGGCPQSAPLLSSPLPCTFPLAPEQVRSEPSFVPEGKVRVPSSPDVEAVDSQGQLTASDSWHK